MGKKLAIKGHSTRGKEVIELLEMLGGKNCFHLHGLFSEHSYYFIGGLHNDEIRAGEYMFDEYAVLQMIDDMCFFTLEEFLEKYPYRVGDKVHIYVQNDDIDGRYDIEVAEITSMRWNPARCKIAYKMKNINREFYKEEIKCKAEESMEDKKLFGTVDNSAETKSCTVSLKGGEAIDNSIDSVQFIQSGKIVAVRFNTQNYENEVELQLDDYEIEIRNGKTYAICKKPKYKYPTTYDDCCDMLNADEFVEHELMTNFPKLINARNAYWKIAGEEMGLDKPWEPDWNDGSQKYCIRTDRNKIVNCSSSFNNRILAFPTEEMRDAFYENFKDLIEQCKELL